MEFLFVGVGGAVGAMLRYGISLTPYKGTFPILTLITNIIITLDMWWVTIEVLR